MRQSKTAIMEVYRSVERDAAFLLVDAVSRFRDPNPGEVGSEQVHRVKYRSANSQGRRRRRVLGFREKEREKCLLCFVCPISLIRAKSRERREERIAFVYILYTFCLIPCSSFLSPEAS